VILLGRRVIPDSNLSHTHKIQRLETLLSSVTEAHHGKSTPSGGAMDGAVKSGPIGTPVQLTGATQKGNRGEHGEVIYRACGPLAGTATGRKLRRGIESRATKIRAPRGANHVRNEWSDAPTTPEGPNMERWPTTAVAATKVSLTLPFSRRRWQTSRGVVGSRR
jgi:hypothetical protein